MGLFARNRRYYLIPVEQKKERCAEIFDRHKNLIGKITVNKNEILVTETNNVICLRIKKTGSGTWHSIEDHHGNYLGRVGVQKRSGVQEIEVDDKNNQKVLVTKGFIEWAFTIHDKQRKKIARGTTTKMIMSVDRNGIKHVRPSFLLSVNPHHPDSRFILAIFIMLMRKMTRTDVTKFYMKFGPALPF